MNVTLRRIAPGSLVVGLLWLSLSAPLSCANSTQPPPQKDAGHHHKQDAPQGEGCGGGSCGAIGQKCCAPPTLCDVGAFCSLTDGTCKDQHPPDIGQACSSMSSCSSGICGYTQGISDGAAGVPDGNGTPPPQPTGCTVGCYNTTPDCTPGWVCQQIVVGQGTCVCTWAAEICNGLDDNCDGIIDNEPEVDNYCTSMMEGIPQRCVEGGVDGGPSGGAHCECVDLCGGTCVNLKTDNMNCGKCLNACKPLVEKCQEGVCGCAFTTCPSGCVNTGANDPMNCGDCGKVCPYSCKMGNCTPSTLASGFSTVGSIAVDSANVYWLAESGTTFTTSVKYCPASGCTIPGVAGTLATAVSSGTIESMDGLAVTAVNVYFADDISSVEVSPIPASPPSPAPKATVYSSKNAGYGTYLASDSVNLYWSNSSDDTIYSCALGTSCSSPTLVSNTSTVGSPIGLAVAGASVYFATSGAVYGTPVSGSGPITKICTYSTGFSSALGVLVAGGNVYFTDGFSAVYSCPIAGTGAVAVTYYLDTSPAALATDGVNLYWSTNSFPSGDIKKCALGATCAAIPGPTTVISGVSPPSSLAVGAKDLFWTTYDSITMGTVLRYSK